MVMDNIFKDKIAKELNNNLDGRETDLSRYIFSGIYNKAIASGLNGPFKVIKIATSANDENKNEKGGWLGSRKSVDTQKRIDFVLGLYKNLVREYGHVEDFTKAKRMFNDKNIYKIKNPYSDGYTEISPNKIYSFLYRNLISGRVDSEINSYKPSKIDQIRGIENKGGIYRNKWEYIVDLAGILKKTPEDIEEIKKDTSFTEDLKKLVEESVNALDYKWVKSTKEYKISDGTLINPYLLYYNIVEKYRDPKKERMEGKKNEQKFWLESLSKELNLDIKEISNIYLNSKQDETSEIFHGEEIFDENSFKQRMSEIFDFDNDYELSNILKYYSDIELDSLVNPLQKPKLKQWIYKNISEESKMNAYTESKNNINSIKVSNILNNHLNGESTNLSRYIFAKIKKEAIIAGYKGPFKVIKISGI